MKSTAKVAVAAKRERFRRLHDSDLFVMPNAWDPGSARLLATLGFPALATTSSGHAATLGRLDQRVTRDEMLTHVAQLVNAVDIPVSVDAERCFPHEPGGVTACVQLIAAAGAAGCSIEDYDPESGQIDSFGSAVQRVAAAADEAHRHGLVLTARADNRLYGVNDLDDTIGRLKAFRAVGADVAYAPGLVSQTEIEAVVAELPCPVNVLASPDGPSVGELASWGVRRVSTGGALAFAAYGALVEGARELLGSGTSTYAWKGLDRELRDAAFG